MPAFRLARQPCLDEAPHATALHLEILAEGYGPAL